MTKQKKLSKGTLVQGEVVPDFIMILYDFYDKEARDIALSRIMEVYYETFETVEEF